MFPFPVVDIPVPRSGCPCSPRGGDTPVPRRGGGYDRSRRRKRIVAGVATPSARARRRRDVFERVAGPPRERVSSRRGYPRSPSWRGIPQLADAQTRPGGSCNSLREGAPPPRRAWASGARRPRMQVSPRRGCSRSRSWMSPFPLVAGDTTARGRANESRRELQLPPRGRTVSTRAHRLREGTPSPRGRTVSARAHRLREGTLPPRGRTASTRAHSRREGTLPPRGHTAATRSFGTQCEGTRLGAQCEATAYAGQSPARISVRSTR